MAIHRLRARLRFTTASGMAAWSHAQMEVRHGMAINISAREPKFNRVAIDGSHSILECDLPLLDAAHAADAFNTLTNASVRAWVQSDGRCFVEHHLCRHDETPVAPCSVLSREVLL